MQSSMCDPTCDPTNTLGAEKALGLPYKYKTVVINNSIYSMSEIFFLMTTTPKPCRYKACEGRIHAHHNEKCPVASARGSTGGKAGTGDVKARRKEENGKFTGLRPCGCPQRQHLKTCKHAFSRGRFNLRQNITPARKIRREINLPAWYANGHNPAMIAAMIRGVSAICSVCGVTHKAAEATKIHPKDFNQNPVRSVCRGCDA